MRPRARQKANLETARKSNCDCAFHSQQREVRKLSKFHIYPTKQKDLANLWQQQLDVHCLIQSRGIFRLLQNERAHNIEQQIGNSCPQSDHKKQPASLLFLFYLFCQQCTNEILHLPHSELFQVCPKWSAVIHKSFAPPLHREFSTNNKPRPSVNCSLFDRIPETQNISLHSRTNQCNKLIQKLALSLRSDRGSDTTYPKSRNQRFGHNGQVLRCCRASGEGVVTLGGVNILNIDWGGSYTREGEGKAKVSSSLKHGLFQFSFAPLLLLLFSKQRSDDKATHFSFLCGRKRPARLWRQKCNEKLRKLPSNQRPAVFWSGHW